MEEVNWTSYGDIYDAIVAAVHSDYAGCDEVGRSDRPQLAARVMLYHSRYYHGDDRNFLFYVRQYLRSLGDLNLLIRKAAPDVLRDWTVGFSVRAARDTLYVTSCSEETRLSVGDQILRVDGLAPAEYREGLRRQILYGDIPERELWDYFLQYAVEYTVLKKGSDEPETFAPGHYPVPFTDEARFMDPEAAGPEEPDTGVSFFTEGPGVCRMKLTHFRDPEAVFQAVNAHEEEICAAKCWILDLRSCAGGSFDAVLPFLTFFIDAPMTAADLFPEKGLYVRYSHGNRGRIPEMAAEPAEKKGFIWEPHEYLQDLEVEITPAKGPEKILLLTDLYCRDEAERFAALASALPKVTLVGRPTLGTSDYQEKMTISFEDDLFFTYPLAKTKAAMEGNGILRKGVPVDEYIPWTPQECGRDVILEKALMMAGLF